MLDMRTYSREGKNAHDDACFVAGTQIATLTGYKNIENIKVGDYVITPFGYGRVTASALTGVKQVINRAGLTATKNHKVFSNKRFDELCGIDENSVSLLKFKDLFEWKYKRLLDLTDGYIRLWGRVDITLVSQRQMKAEKVRKDFMLRFGSMVQGKEYLKAIVFTIKTMTLLITTLATLSVFRLGNIFRIMQKRILKVVNIEKETKKILTK